MRCGYVNIDTDRCHPIRYDCRAGGRAWGRVHGDVSRRPKRKNAPSVRAELASTCDVDETVDGRVDAHDHDGDRSVEEVETATLLVPTGQVMTPEVSAAAAVPFFAGLLFIIRRRGRETGGDCFEDSPDGVEQLADDEDGNDNDKTVG